MAIRTDKPSWLRVRLPGSPRYLRIRERAKALSLATVCQEAKCPNIGECWGSGTATFLVLGDTCTRGCRFCAVKTSRNPAALDPDEPAHLAEAVAAMELDYVVLTSVDRDDLEDGGSAQFARCVEAIHEVRPAARVEVLIPDYQGARLQVVLDARPVVLAHNLETVERLSPSVRDPRADYRRSLAVLAEARERAPHIKTKSSIMVGLGETLEEVEVAMRDLRAVGVDYLTLGQYLQPSRRHLEVVDFVRPEQFEAWAALALSLGFEDVASGPLVRSSYRAHQMFHPAEDAAAPTPSHSAETERA
ncbi:MAG: lipoyl synthase [Deltaproteobacteria bacterium]|nr:lipoyl synthase [Deltaproteobacteria bacterium]